MSKIYAAVAAFAVIIVSLLSGNAFADDTGLDAATVKRFVKTMPDVQAYAEKMESEGRSELFDKDENPMMSGDFTPYTSGVSLMREHSAADHKAMEKILKTHGFTLDEWADTGDRVLAAYIAIEMGKNPDYAGLAQMDPSMLEAMPPQAKAQFAGIMKTMEKIKNVPEADKAAVEPNVADLELFMAADTE